MATDPRNRTITVSYPGGTVTGARGLIEYFMPVGALQWTPQADPLNPRKRKYGTLQRTNARPGRVHYIKMDSGETYSLRVTGTSIKFVDRIIAGANSDKVVAVYTQSGTKYARQFPQAVAP